MQERISDEPIRKEKVKRLKEKILAEIEKEFENKKKRMSIYEDYEDFELFIKESFAMLYLKQYVEKEYSFMSFEAKYYNEDIVIYMVSDRELEVWLQDDYSFLYSFLYEAEQRDYNVFSMLNDNYFGYSFTSVIDYILYDKRKEIKSS